MKRSMFADEQIAYTAHQVDTDITVDEFCRKIDIGQPTFYNWVSNSPRRLGLFNLNEPHWQLNQ